MVVCFQSMLQGSLQFPWMYVRTNVAVKLGSDVGWGAVVSKEVLLGEANLS